MNTEKFKTEIIGTDCSLDECKRAGYLMLEYDKPFSKDADYRVFAHYPEYAWNGESIKEDDLRVDTSISWSDLLEIYKRHQKGIDSFADDMPKRMRKRKPDIYDLLHAAETINMYCGLD